MVRLLISRQMGGEVCVELWFSVRDVLQVLLGQESAVYELGGIPGISC
jgi:hypothetical protein